MCIFTCLRFMVISKSQYLVKNRPKIVYLTPEIVKIYPWCLLISVDSSVLDVIDKFDENYYISTCFWPIQGSTVIFQGHNVIKNKPKIAAYVPKTRNFNLVLANCVETSLITVIDNRQQEHVCQYMFRQVHRSSNAKDQFFLSKNSLISTQIQKIQSGSYHLLTNPVIMLISFIGN